MDDARRGGGGFRLRSAQAESPAGPVRMSSTGESQMLKRNSNGNHAALSEFETKIASEIAIWRDAEWGAMRVGYETYLSDFDDRELLKGLPDDRCQCPHWGYLIAGRMTVRYADHEEVVNAGEVYYMAPGHTMATEAGTVLIEFSPKDEFEKLTEIAQKNFARMTR
jgi:hypothetical protein